MRIIAGKYKKSNLFSLEGHDTRPTTDALRESVFSSLFDVTDYSVLDLFAGSGAYGLEALSRGAKFSVFVDSSYYAIQVIRKNVNKMKCRSQTKIIRAKVYKFLEECNDKFDLIFLDPPYNKAYVNRTLNLIEENELINDGGLIVAEHFFKEDLDAKWDKMIIYKKDKGHNRVAIIKYDKSLRSSNENL